MSEEVRRQLMEMAGIQNVEEFDEMVRQVAPNVKAQKQAVGGETSPFQVNPSDVVMIWAIFMKMRAGLPDEFTFPVQKITRLLTYELACL